jgi:BirA family biotin operon repressor/biotin-[acetyl-CoA-carboxylase] ligase
LQREVETQIDRNQLVAELQQQLVQTLQHFERRGFADFVEEFNLRNEFAGQNVQLSGASEPQFGLCQGVDHQGGLILLQGERLQTFFGGELSLRGKQ